MVKNNNVKSAHIVYFMRPLWSPILAMTLMSFPSSPRICLISWTVSASRTYDTKIISTCNTAILCNEKVRSMQQGKEQGPWKVSWPDTRARFSEFTHTYFVSDSEPNIKTILLGDRRQIDRCARQINAFMTFKFPPGFHYAVDIISICNEKMTLQWTKGMVLLLPKIGVDQKCTMIILYHRWKSALARIYLKKATKNCYVIAKQRRIWKWNFSALSIVE